jgi:hypothetical protein
VADRKKIHYTGISFVVMPTLYTSLGLLSCLALGWFSANWWRRRQMRDPIRKHPRGMEDKLPYRLNPSVLTVPETALYEALLSALPPESVILAKVRLGDLLQVTYGAGDRGEAHARVGNKSLDFVICDSALSPQVALTLQGTALDRAELQTRTFISQVCGKIGLPLVQVPVAVSYSSSELGQLLSPHLREGTTKSAA